MALLAPLCPVLARLLRAGPVVVRMGRTNDPNAATLPPLPMPSNRAEPNLAHVLASPAGHWPRAAVPADAVPWL